jgi:hypothetical protein
MTVPDIRDMLKFAPRAGNDFGGNVFEMQRNSMLPDCAI